MVETQQEILADSVNSDNHSKQNYEIFNTETLGKYLAGIEVLAKRLGGHPNQWEVSEIGDGNLNLVFKVVGKENSFIVKQALPYVRLVGDSWLLPLKRIVFEHAYFKSIQGMADWAIPEIYYFDQHKYLMVMEYFSQHCILRDGMNCRKIYPHLGEHLGKYLAYTLFKTSDLHMPTADKKAAVAFYSDNVELCDITESLIFTDPYYEAKLNHHTSPQLDHFVQELRQDIALKVQAQELLRLFTSSTEALLHGDVHTGSVMVTEIETKIIDPEFSFYGPMGFDIGNFLANLLMNYHAQPYRQIKSDITVSQMQNWILQTFQTVWQSFTKYFSQLWKTERHGILYTQKLFEESGNPEGAEIALQQYLERLEHETLGFAGVEILRRNLSLAHISDIEDIADRNQRAEVQKQVITLGRNLIVNREQFTVDQIAKQTQKNIPFKNL